MITERDAISIIKKANIEGINVWIDGGWGVDALLEKQTRDHNDIDLVIEMKNYLNFIDLIKREGFYEVKESYTSTYHTVWHDIHNRIIDLHLVEFDEEGIAHYENDVYPPGSLSATGKIDGIEVCCVSAQAQILFHLGYEHDENDIHDVMLLCKKFDIPIPDEYRNI